MIKKIIALTLSAFLLFPLAIGCTVADDGRITVLCTVFPIYDWVRNIVGENGKIEVKLLVSDGADLHSYQPTADDVIDIDKAELIVRVGGESDSFLNKLIDGGDSRDLRLMEAQGVTLRHMSKETHEHTDENGHDHATDEHIWLSLKNASAAVEAICDAICELDGDNTDSYRANAQAYTAGLNALDGEYSAAVSSAKTTKLLFADRFPFVYMTDDYGIEYCAAFEGCTTEADASFETVIRLANTLDEWSLSYVCVTESPDVELAESVINASKAKNAEILAFNSMQSVRASDIAKGDTYLGIMNENLKVLRTALN